MVGTLSCGKPFLIGKADLESRLSASPPIPIIRDAA